MKTIIAIYLAYALLILSLWGALIYALIHFVSKFW